MFPLKARSEICEILSEQAEMGAGQHEINLTSKRLLLWRRRFTKLCNRHGTGGMKVNSNRRVAKDFQNHENQHRCRQQKVSRHIRGADDFHSETWKSAPVVMTGSKPVPMSAAAISLRMNTNTLAAARYYNSIGDGKSNFRCRLHRWVRVLCGC